MAQPVAQTVPGLVRDECEVWACKIAAFAVLIFAMRRSLPKNRQRCTFFFARRLLWRFVARSARRAASSRPAVKQTRWKSEI